MVLMNEELRAELLRRVAADQDARHALDLQAMAAADGENLPWLRQVITGVGWPGKSLVGEDGAQAIARDGRFEPRKLRDPDHVDRRRASIGLGSLADYLARMAEHHAPEPMRVPCPACRATIEAWPPDAGETRTATCPACGQTLTFRTAG
jgi:hypothetical protein